MVSFLGEYDCRIDDKGRIKLPSELVKQIPEEAQNTFVVNRGFEDHLFLYPSNEWDKITEEIGQLNPYDKKTREFRWYFYRGANKVVLDKFFRILVPKRLFEYAGIDRDIVLFAHDKVIEIWNKEKYDTLLTKEPKDFAELAEQVMVKRKNASTGD